MLPFISATHSPKFEQKMSKMLSFDLRRKTKHHRTRNHNDYNSTVITPAPPPTTESDQEEMEFTLRVCLAKSRAHINAIPKTRFKQVSNVG